MTIKLLLSANKFVSPPRYDLFILIDVLALDPESVKVPQHDVYLGLDTAGGPGGQPVPLPAAGHQVSVLQSVASAQEVLRDRVSEVTARPPRDNLATRHET